MMFLDLKTVFISNVAISFICTLFFLSLWLNNKNIFKGLSFWVVGMTAQLIGSILILLRGNISDFLSIVVANIVIVGGILVFYIGFRIFIEKPSRQVLNYILLVLFAFILYYFTFINVSLFVRTVALAAIFFIYSFQWAWLSLYSTRGNLRQLTKGIGFVFVGYCLVNLVRIIVAVAGIESINNDFFAANSFDVWIVFIYSLLIILMAYNLILLINRRLAEETHLQGEKFSKAFRLAPYAMLITRLADGQITDVNRVFTEISGYSHEEAVGKRTLGDLHLWLNEEDRANFTKELSKNNKINNKEFRYKRKSGEIFTALVSSEVIDLYNEKYVLSIVNDITRLREIEESLKKANYFMTGREIKMMELKKKIKELEDDKK